MAGNPVDKSVHREVFLTLNERPLSIRRYKPQKYRMGLRARRDVFGGEERVTVSVMFAGNRTYNLSLVIVSFVCVTEPLDYTGDARRLLNDIQSILSRENTRKRLPETAKHEGSAA